MTNRIRVLCADNTSWKIENLISCQTYSCNSYFDGSGTPGASVTTWPTCLARWCSWTTWAPCSSPPPSRSSWRSPSWWSTLKAAGCWRRGSASSPASSSRSSSSSSSSSSSRSSSPGGGRLTRNTHHWRTNQPTQSCWSPSGCQVGVFKMLTHLQTETWYCWVLEKLHKCATLKVYDPFHNDVS